MGKDRRTLKNYLKSAAFSTSLTNIFGLCMLIFTALLATTVSLISKLGTSLAAIDDINIKTATFLQSEISFIGTFFILLFITIMIFTVGFFVIFAQKIGGPMVAICAVIEQLKTGNYEITRELRPGDELNPIMDKLKELGKTLNEQKKN